MSEVLDELMATIAARKSAAASLSYTSQLLQAGVLAIAAKVREETGELIEAAATLDQAAENPLLRAHFVHETADVIYHLSVLLASQDVAWHDVWLELARRSGTSGLAEKAARQTVGFRSATGEDVTDDDGSNDENATSRGTAQ